MNSEIDGFLGFFGAFLLIGAVILVFVLGIFLLPVVIIIAGGLYYMHNTYLPAQREAKAEERTAIMLQQAARIAPRDEAFIERLTGAGITDDHLLDVAGELYRLEGLAPPPPPPPFADTIEGARYRDRLLKYIENAQAGRFDEFLAELVKILKREQQPLGSGMFEGRARRTPEQVEELIMQFYGTDDCFRDLRAILDRNYNEQDDTLPTKYKGDNCAWDYLKDTPLLELEYTTVRADLENRTAHTMILGGSGSGKTNLIKYIIGRDLVRDDCTVVVLDSQVQLIPELANLEIPIDEVAYLNPSWNMGLNLFDVGYLELTTTSDAETAINKAVGLIRFVLEGTLTGEISDRQRTMFDYAIQLIISIPGGNILTFLKMLEEDGINEYGQEIGKLDKTSQDFFMRDWGSPDYKKTREAVRAKLQTLLKNPTFRRLFAVPENNFRVYDELRRRKLILLDTNKPMLDKEASSFLGRLYIAMIVQAAHRRFDNGGTDYAPVYFVIDEAQEYFDERIAEMLEQARKANIGLILAHQTISQIKRERLDPATVIGNTATKIVSTTLPDDAATMAKSMRIKGDEILDLPQYTFAMHNRQVGVVPIRAPENALAGIDYRSDKGALQVAMEARYGARTPANMNTENPSAADADQQGEKSSSDRDDTPTPPDDFDLDDAKPI